MGDGEMKNDEMKDSEINACSYGAQVTREL